MKSQLQEQLNLIKLTWEKDLANTDKHYREMYQEYVSKCNHTYDDGTCAKKSRYHNERYCDICGIEF